MFCYFPKMLNRFFFCISILLMLSSCSKKADHISLLEDYFNTHYGLNEHRIIQQIGIEKLDSFCGQDFAFNASNHFFYWVENRKPISIPGSSRNFYWLVIISKSGNAILIQEDDLDNLDNKFRFCNGNYYVYPMGMMLNFKSFNFEEMWNKVLEKRKNNQLFKLFLDKNELKGSEEEVEARQIKLIKEIAKDLDLDDPITIDEFESEFWGIDIVDEETFTRKYVKFFK